MRVNGEPVSETEFEAIYAQLPDDMQRQFSSEAGKMAFAEQVIRIKLMEQEARKLGIDRDPKVAGQLSADRMNVLANAAAQKAAPQATDDAVLKYYKENSGRFEAIDVSHIAFAFEGGRIPARAGHRPRTQVEAVNAALAVYQELRKGGDFATIARRESDDVETAPRGGELGHFTRGSLPQELEARIWAIPPGQFSGPIPSPLAVHIFRVNSRGTAPIEKVRAGIAQRVQQQNMFDRVELLRHNAKVDFDPKFFPEAKNWHGGPPTRRPS
jgi:peptidyl-prolyl cis-trans isomerase C